MPTISFFPKIAYYRYSLIHCHAMRRRSAVIDDSDDEMNEFKKLIVIIQ